MKLVVLAHAPESSEPAEGALDDPTARQNLEATDVVGSFLPISSSIGRKSPRRFRTPLPMKAVRRSRLMSAPDVAQAQEGVGETGEQELRAVTIPECSRDGLTTARTRPSASTRMCLLRPQIFLAPHRNREAPSLSS